MIKHTFFEKCCTIFKDSYSNTGLNPVAELNYGKDISRVLIQFNVDDLKMLYNDKEISDDTIVKHILHMTNCGSINNDIHNDTLSSSNCNKKERATSFDILILKVPKFWDSGKGVDYNSDFWDNGRHIYSESGCNWYQRVNGGNWEEEGVYSKETIYNEYQKFINEEESFVIAEKHFDIGNESFEFDITEYVNNIIKGAEKNNGLLICFNPLLEDLKTEKTQYVGFFTHNTHTFFHPYLETIYDNSIKDNRTMFNMGKLNRLYLYCNINGEFINLDNIPSCSIEGLDQELVVKQQKKGVYYVEFLIKKGSVEVDTILYDKWSNLSLNGEKLEDQEYEFTVLDSQNLFSIMNRSNKRYVPSLMGVKECEEINRGDIRTIEIVFREEYTTNVCKVCDNCSYRIYIKDGKNEIEVFQYQPIDVFPYCNSITIDTNDLVPNTYYMDIKKENDTYKKVLEFDVI